MLKSSVRLIGNHDLHFLKAIVTVIFVKYITVLVTDYF